MSFYKRPNTIDMSGSNPEKVLIYVRVSSKEQVDGSSLSHQENVCREYAKNNSYEVEKVFVEEGESAKTANRTKLLQMMDYVKKNPKKRISKIIVYKLDRFTRNVGDHHELKAYFKNHGIDVISATEKTDNTSAGKLNENMLAAFAQYDNDLRTERCSNGMKEAVKNGRWVWEAPTGYINNRAGKGKSNLEVDPKKAELIKAVFRFLDAGHTIEETRNLITKEGLTSKDGKAISKTYFHKQ
jgi:site-specific DNA recombinase